MFEAAARVLSISAHTDLGEVGSADEAGAANDDYCGTGARFQTTYHRILRARLLMAEDRIDEGLDILNGALEIIQEIGEEEAARAVLSPLLSSFNQERETRDMKRARSVLKTL